MVIYSANQKEMMTVFNKLDLELLKQYWKLKADVTLQNALHECQCTLKRVP